MFPCYNNGLNFIMVSENGKISAKKLVDEHINYVIEATSPYRLYCKNDIICVMLKNEEKELPLSRFSPISDVLEISQYATWRHITEKIDDGEYAIVVDDKKKPLFVLDRLQNMVNAIKEAKEETAQRLSFFQRIFGAMEDEIFITDEYGFIVYMNPRSEEICNIKFEDYVGHHVSEMVDNDILPKSITMDVIKTGNKIAEITYLSYGRNILSTSQPIYDQDGKMINVLSTSKDIKEINELVEQVKNISAELDDQKKENQRMQMQIIEQNKDVFESKQMQAVQKTIMKIAPTNISVLIEGDSGTGKEVISKLIYRLSQRQNEPFIKINCGLIPKDLLESELFGYMSGAFTGADKRGKIGKIETANGGTIFFDEVGELPFPLQVKLLEFLQDRHIVRVGGVKEIPVDVRVIAATNRDLKEMIDEGTFRSDLYYRLSSMPIYLHPLCERQEDIIPLAHLFLRKFNDEYHCSKIFKDDILSAFLVYEWPGNVRELMHTIERLIVISEKDIITADQFHEMFVSSHDFDGNIVCKGITPLKQARMELESTLAKLAYEKYNNMYAAADALEIDQSTLSRILKKYR